MISRSVENFRYVQVYPEAIDDKLDIHMLLLDGNAAKRGRKELEIADTVDFGLNNILRLLPGGIAKLPNHISARPAVFAVCDRLNEE